MKVIVGAGGTSQDGWCSLERSQLDIRQRESWQRLFLPNSLQAVLSEHVMEHLTPSEAQAAARNIFEFLRPGGYWRIAVPDVNNPDPIYRDWNAPNGKGQQIMQWFVYAEDEPTHKVFYNLCSLRRLLESIGFKVKPLEFYGRDGRFYKNNWSAMDGEIYRSYGHSYLPRAGIITGVYNTSLIVDAFKVC